MENLTAAEKGRPDVPNRDGGREDAKEEMMTDPQPLAALSRAITTVRAVYEMILGLLPANSNKRREGVTRDEIAALFAADLSRRPDRRP